MQICEKCETIKGEENKRIILAAEGWSSELIKSKDKLFRSLSNKEKIFFFFFYKGKLIEPNGSGSDYYQRKGWNKSSFEILSDR